MRHIIIIIIGIYSIWSTDKQYEYSLQRKLNERTRNKTNKQ